jgi:glycosyltransferase involved in cell wall biosynthesis
MTDKQLDVKFYREVHQDLHIFKDADNLNRHWTVHGKTEKRLASQAHFYDIYPDFDISSYRLNNPKIALLSDNKILQYYHADRLVQINKINGNMKKVLIVMHIGNGNNDINQTSLAILEKMLLMYSPKYNIDVYISYNKDYEEIVKNYSNKLMNITNISITINMEENLGADLYPFIKLLIANEQKYDLVVKLHSKTISPWSIDLISAIYDIDYLFWYMDSNPGAGIIGSETWQMPLYAIGNNEYINGIYELLNKQFNFTRDERGFNYAKEIERVYQNTPFNLLRYMNSNYDAFAYCKNLNDLEKHANNSVNSGEIRKGCVNINECNFMNFIAGTIFAIRGDLFLKYKEEIKAFNYVMDCMRNNGEQGYVSDNNGTKFTFTHASERIIQVLAYKYGYTVNGVASRNVNLGINPISLSKKSKEMALICIENLTDSAQDILKLVIKLNNSGKYVTVLSGATGSLESEFQKYSRIIIFDGIEEISLNNPVTPDEAIVLINKVRKEIETINPVIVFIKGIKYSNLVYAAYDAKRTIVMYIPESIDNGKEIIEFANNGGLIAFDFMNYVNLCIAPNDNLRNTISTWTKNVSIRLRGFRPSSKNGISDTILSTIPKLNTQIVLNLRSSFNLFRYKNTPNFARYTTYGILQGNVRDVNSAATKYYSIGIQNNHIMYRLPVICKKTILFVLHEGSLTGAPKVGCLIANHLQKYFNVIMLSMNGDKIISSYLWEHPPIIIQRRKNEFGLLHYLERLELARQIIKIVSPDLVYVNSTAAHVFYHAAMGTNIPTIYSVHEGPTGMDEQLKGFVFPFDKFFNNLPCKESLFYSCSLLCTNSLYDMMGLSREIPIKEFQTLDIKSVINDGNEVSLIIYKRTNRLLIGMVGSRSHRKGFDIFIEIARLFPNHDFIWIGAKDITVSLFGLNNIFLVDSIKNPYNIIKQFDYMIITSREDMAPLIVTEAVMLNIPVILCKPNISCWEYYGQLGCGILEEESSVETWKYVLENITQYKPLQYDFNLLNKYSIENIAENISNDIARLTGGFISGKLSKYYDHILTGTTIYNHFEVTNIINDFCIQKPIMSAFDHMKYVAKYQELITGGLTTAAQLCDHYRNIGYLTRNCNTYDWKLYLSQNPGLLKDFIDSAEMVNMKIKDVACNIKFNVKAYLENNIDLQKANFSEKDALEHWKKYGVNEGRSCAQL